MEKIIERKHRTLSVNVGLLEQEMACMIRDERIAHYQHHVLTSARSIASLAATIGKAGIADSQQAVADTLTRVNREISKIKRIVLDSFERDYYLALEQGVYKLNREYCKLLKDGTIGLC